jgi:hypothetical protein
LKCIPHLRERNPPGTLSLPVSSAAYLQDGCRGIGTLPQVAAISPLRCHHFKHIFILNLNLELKLHLNYNLTFAFASTLTCTFTFTF